MNIELICLDEERLKKITNYEERIGFFENIRFVLLVDKIPVVDYLVILEKYNGLAASVSSAEIQYSNRYIDSNDELKNKYVNRGFTKSGLKLLLDYLFKYNIPYVHLDINNNNIASIKVAESCGLQKSGESYYKFHPNARNLYEYSLGNKLPKDIIMARFEKFISTFNTDESIKKY